MLIVRVPGEAHRKVRERLEQDAPSPEEVFERGARSYIEHPRVVKLTMGESPEERMEELLLMLAQNRASCGVMEIWNATEGRDYAATREEYTALADEFEQLQEQRARLEAEIKALSRKVTQLETNLRELGGEPDTVGPPFPRGVARPPLEVSTPEHKQGLLGEIWRRLSGLLGGS